MTLLIGRDPRQHVEQERHCQVGGHHVDPDSQGQRREKREQVRILFDRFGEENRDAQVHEGHREVNTLDEKIKKIGLSKVDTKVITYLPPSPFIYLYDSFSLTTDV